MVYFAAHCLRSFSIVSCCMVCLQLLAVPIVVYRCFLLCFNLASVSYLVLVLVALVFSCYCLLFISVTYCGLLLISGVAILY